MLHLLAVILVLVLVLAAAAAAAVAVLAMSVVCYSAPSTYDQNELRPMPKPNKQKKVMQAGTGFLLGGAAAAAFIATTCLVLFEYTLYLYFGRIEWGIAAHEHV